MKEKIGNWLLKAGLYLTGKKLYTVPEIPHRDLSEMDFTKCQCGHKMYDHQPDPDGHGTICLPCFATMRHKPQAENILDESMLYEEI